MVGIGRPPALLTAVVAVVLLAVALSTSTSAQTTGSAGFAGAVPSGGGVALLTTTVGSTPDALAAMLVDAGCDVESLALLEDGAWVVFVQGAFAQVNAPFPPRIAGSTPFFVRCRPVASPALDPANATYAIGGQTVTLVDGRAEEQAAPGSATMIITQLSSHQAYGDLDGDGRAEAAVVLIHDPGGSGTFYYLAAQIVGPSSTAIGTVLLGDRIEVERVVVARQGLSVTYLDRAPTEPFAAPPTIPFTRTFEVQDGALVDTGARIALRNDSGGSITIAQGEEFDIVLEANPSTGFRWEVDPDADAAGVVEQVGESQFAADSTLPGAGGETTFTFRGTADGTALLRLRYWRSFEPNTAPLRTFEVNITVQ